MVKIKRFVPNESDDLHCLQCCYIMAVESLTDQSVTMKEAEQDTRFIKGKLTWQFACLLSLAKKGLKVKEVNNEDLELFVVDQYAMINKLTRDPKLTNQMIKMADMGKEINLATQVIKNENIDLIRKTPSIQEIETLIDQDYIIICSVNSRSLAGKEGHMGHAVIVENYDDNHLYLKNPGLPAIENQKVTKEIFTKAWHDPREEMANFIAISK